MTLKELQNAMKRPAQLYIIACAVFLSVCPEARCGEWRAKFAASQPEAKDRERDDSIADSSDVESVLLRDTGWVAQDAEIETVDGKCDSIEGCAPACPDDDCAFLSDCLSFGDHLKDIPLGSLCPSGAMDETTLSFGGQIRYRYMDEDNRLRPFGPARSTYDLWRWTNYLELKHTDLFRLYVEMIDASIFDEDLPPTFIDENRADILQAYGDVLLFEWGASPVVLRAGRQFLKYGSQRLVSPLAWANTYRNFEGIKLFSHGDAWDIDAFATRPVNGATGNINRPTSRDQADASRTFSGVYATYHGASNHTVDFYWLWLREQEPRVVLADGSRHTIGVRWEGNHAIQDCCGDVSRTWNWDVEGAYQFGHDNDAMGVEQTVKAGFVAGKLSHTWNQVSGTPSIAGVFHWGSGDDDPNSGDIHTVSTLFPLGHAYWGLIDNFAGQNLIDYSLQATVKPTDDLTCVAAIHWFNLANGNDFVYNVGGVALGPGGTGSNLGQELDLLATYKVNEKFSVQAGYFWHWYGDAINNGPLARDDASQFYVMPTFSY